MAPSLKTNIERNVYYSVKRICISSLHIENVNVNVLSDLSIDAMDVSGEQQVRT